MTTPQARRERTEEVANEVARWQSRQHIIEIVLAYAIQEAEQASAQERARVKHDIAEVVAQARIAEEASIEQARAEERERCAKLVEDHGHSNGRIRVVHRHLAAALRAAPPPA